MGSPITFSGFNDIDFNVVLNGLMQQASGPLLALQARQTALKAQGTTFTTLGSHVTALANAAKTLSQMPELTTLAATSSQPAAVAVTAAAPTAAGQYEIAVNALARAQVTVSSSVAPDADTTTIANGGTITIGGVTVTIQSDVTLRQLADAINQTAGVGVNAAVVRTAANSYRLALTSTVTGAAGAFTVSAQLTGGPGVTFADTDQNGVSGDSPADNAVSASDASLLVNNVPVTFDTNVFTDVIPGVTFTALATTAAGAPVQVQVAEDTSALLDKIDAFVSAYNELATFINDQRAAANRGETSIGRDPVVRQLHGTLRAAILAPYGSQAMTRLSEVGFEFGTDGKLSLNRAAFEAALAADGTAVRQLFAGTGGAFPAIAALVDSYAASNGFLANVRTQVDRQVTAMDDQIAAMQSRLALQREALARQFTEADIAISRLRNQSSSLGTFGGGLGSL